MPKVALYNTSGAQVGDIELSDAVFGIEPNKYVVHSAVVLQLASQRLGTHKTKGRSEVRGGGRKPWRQKGTGRARQGSILLLNGKAAASYSDRLRAAMDSSCRRKCAVLRSSPRFPRK